MTQENYDQKDMGKRFELDELNVWSITESGQAGRVAYMKVAWFSRFASIADLHELCELRNLHELKK